METISPLANSRRPLEPLLPRVEAAVSSRDRRPFLLASCLPSACRRAWSHRRANRRARRPPSAGFPCLPRPPAADHPCSLGWPTLPARPSARQPCRSQRAVYLRLAAPPATALLAGVAASTGSFPDKPSNRDQLARLSARLGPRPPCPRGRVPRPTCRPPARPPASPAHRPPWARTRPPRPSRRPPWASSRPAPCSSRAALIVESCAADLQLARVGVARAGSCRVYATRSTPSDTPSRSSWLPTITEIRTQLTARSLDCSRFT